jgi:hypothetical protein
MDGDLAIELLLNVLSSKHGSLHFFILHSTLAKDCNNGVVASLKRKAGLFFPLSKKS